MGRSLDHAPLPARALSEWALTLRDPRGLLIIAWSDLHLPMTVDRTDVFGAYQASCSLKDVKKIYRAVDR